jgi:hypothetical protein
MSETRKQLAQWGRLHSVNSVKVKSARVRNAIKKADNPSWLAYDAAKREAEKQKTRAQYFKRKKERFRNLFNYYKKRNDLLLDEISRLSTGEGAEVKDMLEALLHAKQKDERIYDEIKLKKRAEHFKRRCANLRTSKLWYKSRNERLEQEIKQAKNAETRIMDMWLEARLLASDLKQERQGDKYEVDAEALEALFNFMSVGE